MTAAGVRFVEGPRREAYGTVAVFEDLMGNRWDLVERTPLRPGGARSGSAGPLLCSPRMGDGHAPGGILTGARERFDGSTDFTVGLEEEYQLLDPATLALTNRFEEMIPAAPDDAAPASRRAS